MGGRLEIGLLGPVECRVDGEVVALRGTTSRTLLAKLALSPARAVSTSELVEALWGEDPPADAAGNLQSYLSRLRRVIGRERLVRTGVGYQLRVTPDDVDVGRVTALVGRTRDAPAAVAVSLMAEALAGWRGEPLADVAGNVAFAPEVARLVEWRAHLLAEWLECRLVLEPASEVLPELERAARSHPMRERIQLLLVRGLHADGRTADALAVVGAYRRRLAEESGLDPGPELTGLAQRILAQDASPVSARPRRRHAPRNRFVGRSHELDLLRVGGPGLVTVTGPGGVGKTRLVQELLDSTTEPDDAHLVLLGELSGGVATAVAAALGLRATPEGVERVIADRIGGRATVLVLDNCEHVLDEARRLAAGLLARCPQLRLVGTSRQRLGVAGERVLRLGPLEPADQVTLFCDRAALLRADFTAPGPQQVADVCALVDGLPLGVELAARREAVFGLPRLRDRLERGLTVLDPAAGGDRTTPSPRRWSGPTGCSPLTRVPSSTGWSCAGAGSGPKRWTSSPPARTPPCCSPSWSTRRWSSPTSTRIRPATGCFETMRQTGLGHLDPEHRAEARDAHARWMQAHIEAVRGLQDLRSPEATPLFRCERVNLGEALAWLVERGAWERAGRLAAALAVELSDDPDLTLLGEPSRSLPRCPTAAGRMPRCASSPRVRPPGCGVKSARRCGWPRRR